MAGPARKRKAPARKAAAKKPKPNRARFTATTRVVYAVDLQVEPTPDDDDAPKEYRTAYIGQAAIEDLREKEHSQLRSGAPRVAASQARYGNEAHRMRIIDLLDCPDGNPLPVEAFETHQMKEHGTIVPNYSKLKDIYAHANREHDFHQPDISLPGQPRSFQLNCKRSTANEEAIKRAGEEYEARKTRGTLVVYRPEDMEKIYTAIDRSLGLETPLPRTIVAYDTPDAVVEKKRIVFEIDSAFMRARELRVRYESIDKAKDIAGETIFDEVASVRAMGVSEDLGSRIRTMYKAIHPDKNKSVSAAIATCIFRVIEDLAGEVEEAELIAKAETDARFAQIVRRTRGWRDWSKENDSRMPRIVRKYSKEVSESQIPVLVKERNMGKEMTGWRNRGQSDRNVYLVMMRNYDAFAEFCYGRLGKHLYEDCVQMLINGYGMQEEVKLGLAAMTFPTTCQACGQISPVYNVYKCFLGGQRPNHRELFQAALPPDRATYAIGRHDRARPALKASAQEAQRVLQESLRAQGVAKPVAGSSGSSADLEVDSMQDDESDKLSDGEELLSPSLLTHGVDPVWK